MARERQRSVSTKYLVDVLICFSERGTPEVFTSATSAAFCVLTGTFPKSTGLGRNSQVKMPSPVRAAACVPDGSVIVSTPSRVPADVGVHSILTMHESPAFSAAGLE